MPLPGVAFERLRKGPIGVLGGVQSVAGGRAWVI
jgi:hypothetical protein